MRIHSLYIYPVKSLGPVRVDSFLCELRGPQHDREWMLVDENDKFLSQRDFPALALLSPRVGANGLTISDREGAALSVPHENPGRVISPVEIWGDTVNAWDEGDAAASWLSERVGARVRLVRSGPGGRNNSRGVPVRFPDSYPLLLITLESLGDLNARLPAESSVSALRFRPNIVVEGAAPWAEDSWGGFETGGARFAHGKPCARCVIVNVDPATGERGGEPLKTLAGFRRQGNKVLFGQYFESVAGVTLRTGMELRAH